MKDSIIVSEGASASGTGSNKSANNSLNNRKSASKSRPSQNKPKKEQKGRKGNEAKNETPDRCAIEAGAPKVDAFQFMMSSRHKSIGRNSPGKELDLNESPDFISKKELKARKSRLESWAEQKGAAKRKREYEEVGNLISYKLEKREEKLKKMLKIECRSDDEVVTGKRRKCAVIESDDEGDEAVQAEKTRRKSRSARNKKGKTGSGEGVSDEKLTPRSVKSWKFKIKLCMDDNKENGEVGLSGDLENVGSDRIESESLPQTRTNLDQSDAVSSDDCVLITDEKEEKHEISEKRVLRTRSRPKQYDDYFLSESDEEDAKKEKKKGRKSLKVAPVFLKAVPKPKLDPELVEARRQFLLSGMPSSLKKEMERQQCIEEIDFDVFPSVSHVQQKSPDNTFWELPKVELKLIPEKDEKIEIKPFSKELFTSGGSLNVTKDEPTRKKIKNVKKIVREIKSQHPDYPVYKIFNSISSKSGYRIKKPEENEKETQSKAKRRGRPKKNPDKNRVVPEFSKPEIKYEESDIHAMWTEKYKPRSSSDIIGNHSSVSSLKEWLTNWIKIDGKKQVKKASDSESEFCITDSDSRDSAKTFGNTVILKGPTGSGKTAAAYAVCNELGFSVLEVNASSKRTGKRLLQDLQEATQSHQVCKNETILSFVKEKQQVPKPKMCVLLVEDVDVVFEQDEGFSAALCQIVATSKRPVILTTTDEPANAFQKITNDHRTISFAALSSVSTVWLQIVCLVEGLYVSAKSIEELLRHNRGDIRRTLLQLQLYVSSGGQRGHPNKSESTVDVRLEGDVRVDDDASNLSDSKLDESGDGEEVQVHGGCLDGCRLVNNYKSFSLPTCNDFETIWWNWPSILNLPSFAKSRLDRREKSDVLENKTGPDGEKLKSLSLCYEALAFADIVCGENRFHESLERRWRTKTKDSLGLDEDMGGYRDEEFRDDLAQAVLSGSIKLHKDKYEGEFSNSEMDLAAPSLAEKRWRSKQLSSEEKLHQVLPMSELLSRKAISLDYMPGLRAIARSECERAASNTKRSNRFYHYLRNLGVRCSDATYKTACDVFQIWD